MPNAPEERLSAVDSLLEQIAAYMRQQPDIMRLTEGRIYVQDTPLDLRPTMTLTDPETGLTRRFIFQADGEWQEVAHA